jgi:hypothetical protein
MECHDVRLLLAFTERPCESVDAAERAAVAQHLNGCPDCAAFVQAERALDDALGQAMRDVPAPADLKPKVLKSLAASRGTGRWKWSAVAATAAALLLAVGMSWYHWSRPVVTIDDLAEIFVQEPWDAERASRYLSEHGLSGSLPPDLDSGYLRTVEIVQMKGRQVAKLGYARTDEQPASAIVLILPHNQFRTDGIEATNVPGWDLLILRQDGCTYLIFFRGQLERLKPIGA